jgi:hypothetical protein
VVVAAHLLVDGVFHRSLHRAGADRVTDPLATSPLVADIVLDRYDTAVRGWDRRSVTAAR